MQLESNSADVSVHKKLSRLNGKINVMTKDKLVEQMQILHLNPRGVKSVLKRRLKSYHKRRLLFNNNTVKQRSAEESLYDYFVVIDFEATCEKDNPQKYHHEIIEFPAVLIEASQPKIIDEFHSYVRPAINKKLSSFCTELTGIEQDVVDDAPVFTEVLSNFEKWLSDHSLGSKDHKFAVVTDGPWDMSRFMYHQCRHSRIKLPSWSRKWINIRKSFCSAYDQTRTSLTHMLESFSIKFEGRPHSGICDSRNIANILIQMINDGCYLLINERMYNRKIDSTNNLINRKKYNGKRFIPISRRELLENGDKNNDEEDEDEEEEESEDDDSTEPKDDCENGIAVENSCKITPGKSSSDRNGLHESDSFDDCADLIQYMSLRNNK